MSYDVSMDVDLGGPEPVTVFENWNYTSNVAPMWRAAGLNLKEFDGHPARDCQLGLRMAIRELRTRPERYDAMNPDNGWGDRESLVEALERLLAAFARMPNAIVRVRW